MHFSVAVMGSWGLFFFFKKKAAASLYYLSDLNVAYTTLLPGVTTLYRLKSWILLMVKAHTFLPTSRIRIFKRKFLGFRNVSLFFFFVFVCFGIFSCQYVIKGCTCGIAINCYSLVEIPDRGLN